MSRPDPSADLRWAERAGNLLADAVRTLTAYQPPSPDQAVLRGHLLALVEDAGPAALTRDGGPEHLTASALVVDAGGERSLLALHGKSRMWVQLGGHLEPGDPTLAEAALREAREESGIDGLRLARPEPVDLDRHELGSAFGTCRVHCDVRYVLVAPPGAVEQISAESLELRWFGWAEVPPAAVPDLGRLITSARAALA